MDDAHRDLEYAGFSRRGAALLLDVVILVPLGFFLVVLVPVGGVHPVISIGLHLVQSVLIAVYLVYRFGGTPGKLIMQLRITRIDGTPVTMAQAFRRHFPELLLSTVVVAVNAIAVRRLGLTLPIFPSFEEARRIQAAQPWWTPHLLVLTQVWTWSELIVMLTNKRRRALHDFIAGTVVIIRRRVEPLPFSTPLPVK